MTVQDLFASNEKYFPTPIQQFQYFDKYSRWLPAQGRREAWVESVERVIKFLMKNTKVGFYDGEWTQLYNAIINLEVMPSMRILQMAGPALERDNVGCYNCAYTVLDSIDSVGELLYILMQGTGIGYSVEDRYVSHLPRVKKQKRGPVQIHRIEDSTEAWCDALKLGMETWFSGRDIVFDYSRIRPAGAILHTKGGRASGPQPLKDLLDFTRATILSRQGKKLSSLDVHDIACYCGFIVQVGGVRRAALISLSDLEDRDIAECKSGEFWKRFPYRSMSNNSAVYEERPVSTEFMEEWLNLAKSGTGERGIFNRELVIPTRRQRQIFGMNPCSLHEDSILMTTDGPRRIKDLKDRHFVAYVDGKPFRAKRGSWVSGRKDLFRLSTVEGYTVDLTADHRVMTADGYKMAGLLTQGEQLKICQQDSLRWSGKGTFDDGYLLGMFVGDGNFAKAASANGSYYGQVKVWKTDTGYASLKEACMKAAEACSVMSERRTDASIWCNYDRNTYDVMNISKLPTEFGICPENKHDIQELELTSSDFHKGFLRGMFDSDGHVEGNPSAGYSIRLSSVEYTLLQSVQRMLQRLGIFSRIYAQKNAGEKLLPDGKGGRKWYRTKKCWRLVISGKSCSTYLSEVGFSHAVKRSKAEPIMQIRHKAETFLCRFKSLTPLGIHDVWDAEVQDINAFDANGFHAHNSEIVLRPRQFCNLSIAVARENDTLHDLERKITFATMLGTAQSTLTHFPYLSPKWKENCEEERLLGVDITGQRDCKLLNGPSSSEAFKWLRNTAITTNIKLSARAEMNTSVSVTCVKPSGNSAQFLNCSSGVHVRYSPYYIRRVRTGAYTPVGRMLKDLGVPCFPETGQSSENPSVLVFEFPVKSPEGSIFRKDVNAAKQFEYWLDAKENYTEHSASCTIYVEDHEWLSLGALVYENWDKISGLSFLPKDNHIYPLAPYEEISKDEYERRIAAFPKIDWSKLIDYEKQDETTQALDYACTGGSCEL